MLVLLSQMQTKDMVHVQKVQFTSQYREKVDEVEVVNNGQSN